MKVLVFSEQFYPHGGGAELATWLYCRALVKSGFQVSVVTRQFSNERNAELLDKIRVYRYPFRFDSGGRYDTLVNGNVIASTFVNKIISESDLVYIPGIWYSAIPVAKAHRKPVVVHVHNYSLACPTSLMYNFAERHVGRSTGKSFMLHEMMQRGRRGASVLVSCFMNQMFGMLPSRLASTADSLVFVSKTQRQLTLSVCPWLERKSHVIYNPIPQCPLVKSESVGIGYLGGKSYIKGFPFLVNAIEQLRSKSKVRMYLAMVSSKNERHITSNGVEINCFPKLNQLEISDLMKKISVVVVPSLNPEPFPYALVEAMLYGKIVVASKVGGIPEIVDDACSGIGLVNPGCEKELAEALSTALTFDLEDAQALGGQNRELILRKFSNESAFKSFIHILEELD